MQEQRVEDCMNKNKDATGTLPTKVDGATLDSWADQARQWAIETRKKIVGRDLPPGFDPDDEDEYTFRPAR
jgi:hypothetical protein